MAEKYTGFQDYLKQEVDKVKGVYVPVRAGLLRRLLIRRVACKKLHPNPDDEFCSPTIGPNSGIISQYVSDFQKNGTRSFVGYEVESLIVEKIRPDGYMILNGHHRWAAAILARERTLPVRIVDLPMDKDIQKMLKNARNDRRVALDLDEVVFCNGTEAAEKPLPYPFSLIYNQRLRLGIPALFRFLNDKGYDIWIYSSNYHSFTHIQRLLWLYHTRVTGIVTGTGKKGHPNNNAGREELKKRVAERYTTTIHIDGQGMLRVDRRTGQYEEYTFNDSEADWSAQIMDLIGALDKNG